eukprot:COSAG05_NODE_101_length_19100_cov_24.260144_5_plen_44_part_00
MWERLSSCVAFSTMPMAKEAAEWAVCVCVYGYVRNNMSFTQLK